jgi:hypothetical protein
VWADGILVHAQLLDEGMFHVRVAVLNRFTALGISVTETVA